MYGVGALANMNLFCCFSVIYINCLPSPPLRWTARYSIHTSCLSMLLFNTLFQGYGVDLIYIPRLLQSKPGTLGSISRMNVRIQSNIGWWHDESSMNFLVFLHIIYFCHEEQRVGEEKSCIYLDTKLWTSESSQYDVLQLGQPYERENPQGCYLLDLRYNRYL